MKTLELQKDARDSVVYWLSFRNCSSLEEKLRDAAFALENAGVITAAACNRITEQLTEDSI